MSREWKPGDVAMVNDTTRPEAPWKVAMCVASKVPGIAETRWRIDSGEVWGSVSDARPLVTIDPEDREAVERLYRLYVEHSPAVDNGYTREMQAALREYANPKPPKPDEPQGLGAVVEDEDGNRWMRHEPDPGRGNRNYAWYPAGYVSDGVRVKWDRITAVRVLSAGVEVSA